MKRLATAVAVIVVTFMVAMMFWMRGPARPPSLTIELLGYTNTTGPFALLAITNTSPTPITLSTHCLVNYSPTGGPRQRVNIEMNRTATNRLLPNQGFVQEVFVFPSGERVWQFEITAAHSSGSLELRRSVEGWVRKTFPSIRFRLIDRFYHQFTTEWLTAPP